MLRIRAASDLEYLGTSTIKYPSPFDTSQLEAPKDFWFVIPKKCIDVLLSAIPAYSLSAEMGNPTAPVFITEEGDDVLWMLPVGQAAAAIKAARRASSSVGCECTADWPFLRVNVPGANHRHVSQSMHEESTYISPPTFSLRRTRFSAHRTTIPRRTLALSAANLPRVSGDRRDGTERKLKHNVIFTSRQCPTVNVPSTLRFCRRVSNKISPTPSPTS